MVMYKTNPIKAIRAKCLECSNGSAEEVKFCTVNSCELYPFRFGKNPYRSKRVMSEEQRLKAIDRLKNARDLNRQQL